MKFISSVLFSLVFSSTAVASDVHNAKIERLMVDTSHGDKVFVKIDKIPGNSPDCSSNGTWQYAFMLDTELKKEIFVSFLLSAYMSNTSVRLTGTGECTAYPSIEALQRVEFL